MWNAPREISRKSASGRCPHGVHEEENGNRENIERKKIFAELARRRRRAGPIGDGDEARFDAKGSGPPKRSKVRSAKNAKQFCLRVGGEPQLRRGRSAGTAEFEAAEVCGQPPQ